MVKYCCAYGCKNNKRSNPDIAFFKLPTNNERFTEWMEIINRKDILTNNLSKASYCVCELHFDPKQIYWYGNRKILNQNAVPINNVAELHKQTQTDITYHKVRTLSISQPETIYIKPQKALNLKSVSSQTPRIPIQNTTRKRKLRRESSEKIKIKRKTLPLNNSCTNLSKFHKLRNKYADNKCADDIVILRTRLSEIKSKGSRYNKQYNFFALNLYYNRPHAYKYLENLLCLPDRSTLSKLNIPNSTCLNDETIKTFQIKLDGMSDAQKKCVLCVNCMSLKAKLFYNTKCKTITGLHEVDNILNTEIAKHAIVIMLKGLYDNWTQPVAYSFLAQRKYYKSVKLWLKSIIKKLDEVGFDIRAFVSDLGTDFIDLSKSWHVTAEKPFFYINKKKIYYLFDAPHLLKELRNNFMTNNFYFNKDFIAKWKHLDQMYEEDKNKALRLVPKLTRDHMNPNSLKKLKVKLASQILSRSVAAAMNTYVDLKKIEEPARSTAKFVKRINDLFDILNSSSIYAKYKYNRPFTGALHQKEFLKEMFLCFDNLKLISRQGKDVTKMMEFIVGFKITIRTIQFLQEDLQKEDFKFILTRRLNQDCLENFFRCVRKQNSNCKPTCRQFAAAFRKLFTVCVLNLSN